MTLVEMIYLIQRSPPKSSFEAPDRHKSGPDGVSSRGDPPGDLECGLSQEIGEGGREGRKGRQNRVKCLLYQLPIVM